MPYHVPETVRPRTKYMHVHHAHDCHRLHYCTQRTEACISGAPREITETPLHRKEFIIIINVQQAAEEVSFDLFLSPVTQHLSLSLLVPSLPLDGYK